jgi:hypothetical protein
LAGGPIRRDGTWQKKEIEIEIEIEISLAPWPRVSV